MRVSVCDGEIWTNFVIVLLPFRKKRILLMYAENLVNF